MIKFHFSGNFNKICKFAVVKIRKKIDHYCLSNWHELHIYCFVSNNKNTAIIYECVYNVFKYLYMQVVDWKVFRSEVAEIWRMYIVDRSLTFRTVMCAHLRLRCLSTCYYIQ